jgi:hypothetical protein
LLLYIYNAPGCIRYKECTQIDQRTQRSQPAGQQATWSNRASLLLTLGPLVPSHPCSPPRHRPLIYFESYFLSHPSLTPHQGMQMANPATRRPWGSGGAPAASSGAEATSVRTPQGVAACGRYGVDTGSSRRWIGLPRRTAPTRCPRGSPRRTAPPRRPRRPPWMWVPDELLPVGDLWRRRGPRGPTRILVQRGRGSSSLASGGAKDASPASCSAEASKRRAGGLPR